MIATVLGRSVCAAAFLLAVAGPVRADATTGWSSIVDGNYAKPNGHFVGGSIFGIGGALTTPTEYFGANFEAEVGYHDIEVGGASHSNWDIGATAFWPMSWGRVGGTVAYHSVDAGGGTTDTVWNYQAASEWFAGNEFTVGAKVGGGSGGRGLGGWYVGGEAIFYPCPDVALSSTIDYARDDNWTFFSRETDVTASVEWLVSQDTPISIYGGYTWTEAHVGFPFGTPHADILFAGVRYYTNGSGAKSLLDRQRTGTAGWISTAAPLAINF